MFRIIRYIILSYDIIYDLIHDRTSSARSATLEDTSWAWLHLASWNLSDSQFCSESKTEPKCSRHRTKFGGGTPHRKSVYGEGGHHTYFLNRVPIGGEGTPHILPEQGANMKLFDQRPRNWWNNYISCLNNYIFCFQIRRGKNNSISSLGSFISCFENQFWTLGENEECLVTEVFWSEAWKWEKSFRILFG